MHRIWIKVNLLHLIKIESKESDFVRMGAHHTLTLELGRIFGITKVCWDQVFLDRIDEACHPERQAEVAAIVMHHGLAHVCLGEYCEIVSSFLPA